MSMGRIQRVIQQLRRAADPAAGQLSDADLLRSFIEQRDEGAFSMLVRRHAAMVLGVCRRVTGNPHDAEDAFQAAFCVLLRKAASIRRREVLGSWLYGVAYRTALAAKVRRARMQRRESQVDAMPDPTAPEPQASADWQPLLDAALQRLPEALRVPIVLCDLEGKSRREAAQQLGLAEGTLSSRLARGRRLLAQRLQRQGLTCSGGALAAWLAEGAATAQAPLALIKTVSQAGALVLTGQAPVGIAFSATVLALTEGVMKSMFLGKLKTLTAVLIAATACTFGGLWVRGGAADPQQRGDDGPMQVAQAPPGPGQPAPQLPTAGPVLRGKIYRIETVISLPDAGDPKSFTTAPVLGSLGQPIGSEVKALVNAPGGQTRPVQISWNVEVVRQRGSDVLVNLSLDKRERQTSALSRGQSLEFEDFVPMDAWTDIKDAAWAGLTFKIKVSSASETPVASPPSRAPGLAPSPVPQLPRKGQFSSPGHVPVDPPMVADPASHGQATTLRLFTLERAKAGALANVVAKAPGLGKVRVGVDHKSNSLIVDATPDDLQRIADMLPKLDVADPAPAEPNPRIAPAKVQAGAAAIAPDGRVLAVANGDVIIMIDVQTGKKLAQIQGDSPLQALAFTPDGKMLASGTQQGVARLWDTATGKELRRIVTKMPVTQILITPDARTIILIGADQSQQHWDLATGQIIRTEPAPKK